MRKIVEVGAGQIELSCNAATPLACKSLFGIDVLRFFENVDGIDTSTRVETLEKITYVMAMQAKKPLPEVLNMGDGFMEWLAQYEFGEITQTIIPAAMALWVDSNTASVTGKNQVGPR